MGGGREPAPPVLSQTEPFHCMLPAPVRSASGWQRSLSKSCATCQVTSPALAPTHEQTGDVIGFSG